MLLRASIKYEKLVLESRRVRNILLRATVKARNVGDSYPSYDTQQLSIKDRLGCVVPNGNEQFWQFAQWRQKSFGIGCRHNLTKRNKRIRNRIDEDDRTTKILV